MRIILIMCILFISIHELNAQCCSAGNPVNTDFNLGFSSNTLTIFSNYKHSFSTDYYIGNIKDTSSSNQSIDHSFFDYQSLGLSYQYKKLNVKTLVGYYFNKNQEFNNGYKREANGWGDLSLTLSYNLSKLFGDKFSFVPNLGAIFPTGTFDMVYNNVVLPIDVQPSAGSLRINGGFLLAKEFMNKRLNIFSYNFIEHSNTIKSERTESYKYGNVYINTLGSAYKLNEWLSPEIQIRNEYREKSIDKGIVMNSTGGHTVFAAAKLNFKYKAFGANISMDLPVYKNVNGIQLTNKYMYSAGISYQINFNKIDVANSAIELKELDKLKDLAIKVRGACGMCKTRIEKIALCIKDIEHTDYNLAEQTLIIYYKQQPNINKLIEGLKTAGHDNEYGKATDEAYKNLHHCCKYER